ncbi:MAG TPA: DUF2339 domain-containing protein, partial [Blastocatellia bacterium]
MTYPDIKRDEERLIQELTARVARLEAHLGLPPIKTTPATDGEAPSEAALVEMPPSEYEGSGLELGVGEFGLAWIGSGVLFLGIVFFMAYAQSYGHRVAASATGYISAIGLYWLAHLWKQNIPHLSRVMLGSSLLLLYYTTMRLGFFTDAPLIGNRYISLLLLLAVVAFQLRIATARDSQQLAAIALVLAVISAMLIDRTHISLPLVVIFSAIAVWLSITREWRPLLPVMMIFAYAAHLLWLLSNPLAGHKPQAVADHQYNLVYLFLYAAIFYWPALFVKKDSADDAYKIASVLLNSLAFSILIGLAVLTNFQHAYSTVYLGVASFFLILSIIQWLNTHGQYTPAIYACFGYMALSISIYGYAKMPTAFLWLSVQSLLVVSMALWFRSRTLVVMNSLIYVNILLGYFALSPPSNQVDFSFAIVALASARVMNWQKERLTLRTDMLRNVYLAIAFVMIFYALYRAVPRQYVTLSWAATAVIYFLFSYWLNSIKYRWMAISAILVTVGYLFMVDLAHLDPLFRVAAFIFVGLMALAISLFYTRVRSILSRKSEE